MFNKSGVSKTSMTGPVQILANVELQASVGCIVPQSLGVTVGAKKIVKAGTPLHINLESLNTAATAVASGSALNAVALHDVDVTAGSANATALIFGFVNLNRIDTTTAATLATARAVSGASPLLTFVKQ